MRERKGFNEVAEEKYTYPWHNCLECIKMFSDECPLDGKDAMEKILNRMRKTNSFTCTRFLGKEILE